MHQSAPGPLPVSHQVRAALHSAQLRRHWLNEIMRLPHRALSSGTLMQDRVANEIYATMTVGSWFLRT